MEFLFLKDTDIYKNLACEEFLLKNRKQDFFIIWQTNNAVVFGKHQNPYQEINIIYALENKIKIARRLSGGGTVFQDNGNINFSFILTKQTGKQIDFDNYIKPIYNFLYSIGINSILTNRHDIFIDNKKISGNAEHIFKNRVLHHGTLLFNSDLSHLNKLLFFTKNKFSSKSIKSVKSKVANISDYLKNKDINNFITNLVKYIKNYYNINSDYVLSKSDKIEINKIKQNKYQTNEWIFDYTAPFNFVNEFSIKNKNTNLKFRIEQGNIVEFNLLINQKENKNLNNLFINQKYYPENILKIIKNNNLAKKTEIDEEILFKEFF